MLSTETILHSLQIENEHKRLTHSIEAIRKLAKTQYNLDWEDMDKIEAPEGMVVSEAYCKDIIDRLNIWCEIDRLTTLIGDQIALIRSTEKKCLERGKK
jgi:hypothetical protein